MGLDAAALLVLGIFIGVGALRGGLVTGLGLLTLAVAYAAAFALAPRLGPGLAPQLGVPEIAGVAAAGSAAFALAYLGMAGVSAGVRRLRRPFRGSIPSARDRFLGGVLGAVRGGLVVLLLCWLAIWVDALRVAGVAPGLPGLGRSAAAGLTASAVEAGLGAALADAGSAGRVVAKLAARPGASLERLQGVVDHPAVAALERDRMFWTYVEHGAVDAALNRGSFQAVARDEALRVVLADLGLVGGDEAADPAAFRDAMAEVLREAGPRLRGLREDPELQALLEDPQLVALVQQGDTLGLLGHTGFRQLVARVASDPATP